MTLTFHSSLSRDYSSILNDADDYNVIIQIGENQNIKEFRAHSVILRARSTYFKGALSSNWITERNNIIMFHKPNVTPVIFEMILKYDKCIIFYIQYIFIIIYFNNILLF
jgi:hypothetical protein